MNGSPAAGVGRRLPSASYSRRSYSWSCRSCAACTQNQPCVAKVARIAKMVYVRVSHNPYCTARPSLSFSAIDVDRLQAAHVALARTNGPQMKDGYVL